MQDSFSDLPEALRRIHDDRSKQLHGRCNVERGASWLVRWLAPMMSLPPGGSDVPLTVAIRVDDQGETWTRNFGGHRMQSRLLAHDPLLAERLGATTLLFTLSAVAGRIEWRVVAVRFLGVPLPLSWFAAAAATEAIVDGHYTFDVSATLPLVGLLIRYRGWLGE
jgi:hypothetical protein